MAADCPLSFIFHSCFYHFRRSLPRPYNYVSIYSWLLNMKALGVSRNLTVSLLVHPQRTMKRKVDCFVSFPHDVKTSGLTVRMVRETLAHYLDSSQTVAVASTGCLLSKKGTNKARGKGYAKAKLRGSGIRREFYLHHLVVLMKANGEEHIKLVGDGKHEVSHLCHQSTCINHDHIVVETKQQHKQRQACHGSTWVSCPCCEHSFSPCKHDPQCILPRN